MAGEIRQIQFVEGETVTINDQGAVQDMKNVGLSVVMAANAATVALKQLDGTTDPSSTGPVEIIFRSATLTSGASARRSVTAGVSVVIPSGATLGQISTKAGKVFVYALDNAGTVELAVSSSYFDESEVASTTAIDTASDSETVMYSTTARTNKAIKLLGIFESTQATAGTWATAASQVAIAGIQSTENPYLYERQVALTVTGSNWTTTKAVGVVYKTIGNVWRMKLNIRGVMSSVAASITLTVAGVVFDSATRQCAAATYTETGVSSKDFLQCVIDDNSGEIYCGAAANFDVVQISGDVVLDSRPSII